MTTKNKKLLDIFKEVWKGLKAKNKDICSQESYGYLSGNAGTAQTWPTITPGTTIQPWFDYTGTTWADYNSTATSKPIQPGQLQYFKNPWD